MDLDFSSSLIAQHVGQMAKGSGPSGELEMEGGGNGVGPFGAGFAFSMHGGCLKVVHCHVGLFEGSLLDLCLNPLTLVFLSWADSSPFCWVTYVISLHLRRVADSHGVFHYLLLG